MDIDASTSSRRDGGSGPSGQVLLEVFDDAIPHPDGPGGAGPSLRGGQRMLRRRRAGAAAGGLALAAVVGGLVLGVGAAGDNDPADRSRAVEVAASGGASGGVSGDPSRAAPDSAPVVRPDPPALGSEFTVRTDVVPTVDPEAQMPGLTPDGDLVVPRGVRVLGVIEEPLGYQAPSHSLAVTYEQRGLPGASRAFLELRPDLVADGTAPLGYEEDGSGGVVEPVASSPHLDFQAWVFARVEFGTTQAWPYSGLASEPFLDLSAGAVVVPDGARLLDQVENPLGLAAPARSVAVAWAEGSAPSATEQWAVVVFDPTWRPERRAAGRPVEGMVNGYALQRQAPVPGLSFQDWAAGLEVSDFNADPPPAWVTGAR